MMGKAKKGKGGEVRPGGQVSRVSQSCEDFERQHLLDKSIFGPCL